MRLTVSGVKKKFERKERMAPALVSRHSRFQRA